MVFVNLIGMLLAIIAWAFMALLLSLQMLMRIALLDVLIAISPLGLVCWILPQTRRWGSLWLNTFVAAVLVQFLQSLTLSLGAAIMATSGAAGGNAITALIVGLCIMVTAFKLPGMLNPVGGGALQGMGFSQLGAMAATLSKLPGVGEAFGQLAPVLRQAGKAAGEQGSQGKDETTGTGKNSSSSPGPKPKPKGNAKADSSGEGSDTTPESPSAPVSPTGGATSVGGATGGGEASAAGGSGAATSGETLAAGGTLAAGAATGGIAIAAIAVKQKLDEGKETVKEGVAQVENLKDQAESGGQDVTPQSSDSSSSGGGGSPPPAATNEPTQGNNNAEPGGS